MFPFEAFRPVRGRMQTKPTQSVESKLNSLAAAQAKRQHRRNKRRALSK